jgi:hypothetical protein
VTIDWTAVGSIATAAAVLLAGWQLRLSWQQAKSAFEDQLEREYRDIAAQLPVAALLGAELAPPLFEVTLTAFYRYIDLTNQQIFLRQHGRISKATWVNWREGIAHNLRRSAFAAAWAQIKEAAPEDFHELRRLENGGFAAKDDPIKWGEASANRFIDSRTIRQPARQAAGPSNGQRP